MAIYLSNNDVRRVLDMPRCIEAFDMALRELSEGRAVNQPRSHSYLPGPQPDSVFRIKLFNGGVTALGTYALRVLTDFLEMRSVGDTKRQVQDRRFNKILVFSLESGDLIGVVEDDYLQRLRVGAESAVVARQLARADSEVVGLLGSGRQAVTQLLGLAEVRPLREVKVFSPTLEHRQMFADRMSGELGIPVRAVDEAREAIRGADIVVAATNSSNPVLHGTWLEPGMHAISLVNSDKHHRRREVDDEVMRICNPIIISDYEQVASDEPADIFDPLRSGLIDWDKLISMADLFGNHPGRVSEDQITMHKNNGLSIQFAAATAIAVQGALELGIGREIPDFLSSSGPEDGIG